MRHHTLVRVEIRIERQGLQRPLPRRLRRRYACHDRLQDFVNANAFLGAARNGGFARYRQNVLKLLLGLRHVRVREVNLVDDRDDFEVLLHRQVDIGDGLRLDSLGGIHHQQRPFARAEAARDFVGEIHVARRINQVQLVGFAVARLVKHRDRMRLDGDAALLFQVHGIEQLVFHFARGDGAGAVQQPVRQRRLPMVNMGDDAEIADMRCVHVLLVTPSDH